MVDHEAEIALTDSFSGPADNDEARADACDELANGMASRRGLRTSEERQHEQEDGRQRGNPERGHAFAGDELRTPMASTACSCSAPHDMFILGRSIEGRRLHRRRGHEPGRAMEDGTFPTRSGWAS